MSNTYVDVLDIFLNCVGLNRVTAQVPWQVRGKSVEEVAKVVKSLKATSVDPSLPPSLPPPDGVEGALLLYSKDGKKENEDQVIEKTLSLMPHFLAFHLTKADDARRLDDAHRITLPLCPLCDVSWVDIFSPPVAGKKAMEAEPKVVGPQPPSDIDVERSLALHDGMLQYLKLVALDPQKHAN